VTRRACFALKAPEVRAGMERLVFQQGSLHRDGEVPPTPGFIWLDFSHDEVAEDPEAWRADVHAAVGEWIFEEHAIDALNLQHPSYFDDTSSYDMIVFRKLAVPRAEGSFADTGPLGDQTGKGLTLGALQTRPITFFLFDHALVTVRSSESRTIDQFKQRLFAIVGKKDMTGNGAATGNRLPARPDELMLRLINTLVDSYLALRQPLTERLDHWQRELLAPGRAFSNWRALLDARIELRKLEALSEEQYDALQEYRDSVLDSPACAERESVLVRINDVMEHIHRVLNHARRLEQTVESAVQLNFSAQAQRTNRIVQILTVVTVIIAPLNLMAGLYGMNFEHIPGAKHPDGFWIMLGAMAAVTVVLLAFFSAKRYIDRSRR
jgi:Mg2+ and Co2+ transporter CorA